MTTDTQWLEENGSRAMALMFRALADAIQKIPASKNERAPEDEFALDAAKRAYLKTKKYFAMLTGRGISSRRDEMDIAKSWEMTGTLLAKYDSTLKPRLSAKALYWQEDGTWSANCIQRADLELEALNQALSARS